MVHFVRSDVLGGKFDTPNRYSAPETLKIGVSGIVCSSWDQIGQQYVAVKKIIQPFNTPATAQLIYREIKLLRHLKHENVIRPLDIFISPREDIYLVTELMQTDLREILASKSLSHEFVQFFLYQLMRGLKYIHSAGVVHRDLEPKNILINENCDLKICDFGLARVQEPQMTGYLSTVSSRLYRAPEIMLSCRTYSEKVDIWSAGCIFAEMLTGKPLFPGKDNLEQFSAITKLLGTPAEETLVKMTSQTVSLISSRTGQRLLLDNIVGRTLNPFHLFKTRSYLHTLPRRDGVGLSSTFPDMDPSALQLMEKMLVFDPDHRISAAEALTSPYLASYHDPTDEPVAEEQFDWTMNGSFCSDDVWKQKLYAEVLEYHKKAEVQESVKRWTQTSSTVQK